MEGPLKVLLAVLVMVAACSPASSPLESGGDGAAVGGGGSAAAGPYAAGSTSVAARRALAQKLSAGEFVARTAGADDTILEVTSKVHGCKLENLIPIVKKSSGTLFNIGFTKMRCIDSGDYVDIDPPPSPAVAAAQVIAEPAASPPRPPAQPPPQDVNVSAEQLRRDYDGNEVSADEHYRNKALVVTGIVKSVKKDIYDDPYVELSTSNMFESVDARFASGHAGELGTFQRGDKIIVRCIGNNVVIGSPQLKDCELQHHYRWRVKSKSE